MKIWKIVVTGGPCAGKTTALNTIKDKLTKKGFKVILVPETATELISSGIYPNELGNKMFHSLLLEKSIYKDRISTKAAQEIKKDTVIVYDRGLLDFKAYIPVMMFDEIMQEHNLKEENVIGMYDAVFHLVTAAKGAEEFYILSNNKARTETIEEAQEIDKKTLEVWKNYQNLKIIDNSTDFDGKINRLLKEIYLILNIK